MRFSLAPYKEDLISSGIIVNYYTSVERRRDINATPYYVCCISAKIDANAHVIKTEGESESMAQWKALYEVKTLLEKAHRQLKARSDFISRAHYSMLNLPDPSKQ